MKVGDLVRHQMYNDTKSPALVLAVDIDDNVSMIKIFDPEIGFLGTWDSARYYEVINEGR